MESIKIFQVDAFTDRLFGGNPAHPGTEEFGMFSDVTTKYAQVKEYLDSQNKMHEGLETQLAINLQNNRERENPVH